MLVSGINKINFFNVSAPTKTLKEQSYLPRKNSIALQSQLNFMGLCNQTSISSGERIFQKYLTTLEHYRAIPGVSILYSKESKCVANIMLFDKPLKIAKALDFLKNKIAELDSLEEYRPSSLPFFFCLREQNFDVFKEAIAKGDIPNLEIKGIIGQGRHSTAFLTCDNKVLKLAIKPNFPDNKYFMEGIDVPIYDRYIARKVMSGKYNVYGALEGLAEVFPIKDITNNEYFNIYSYFGTKTKAINEDYSLQDFCAFQVGVINGKHYIIDHECVVGRPLVGE